MKCYTRSTSALVPLFVFVAACQPDEDLTRALDAGVGRSISAPPPRVAQEWTELASMQSGRTQLAFRPVGVCLLRDRVVVADARTQRILVFDGAGKLVRLLGGRGSKPGQFSELASVRCSDEETTVLATDAGNQRVSFFSVDSGFVGSRAAPVSPQIPIVGDYALAGGGRLYSSWLGSTIPLGPYLSDAEWEQTALIELHAPDGRTVHAYGRPVEYRNTVARRVLNRTFLLSRNDTVWALTQGDATLRGYAVGGAAIPPIRLPVYFRGKEPSIKVGKAFGHMGFRPNEMTYDPNVRGLAGVGDSLFAAIRYRNWGYKIVGRQGNRTVDRWAESALEVFDRTGHVRASFSIPGMATDVAGAGDSRIAVLTRMRDGTRKVLLATLPIH